MTYLDGTEQNLGVVVGKDGADGTNGIDGRQINDVDRIVVNFNLLLFMNDRIV